MRAIAVVAFAFGPLAFASGIQSSEAAQCAHPNLPVQVLQHPDWPPLAQQQGVSGTVTVAVSLDADSNVAAAKIQSSPSVLLNDVAIDAARTARFRTEIRDCVPVASTILLSLDVGSGEDGQVDVARDLNTQAPHAPVVSKSDTAFRICKATVQGNGGDPDSLDGKSRIARCVGGRGYRNDAIAYLHQALVESANDLSLPPNLEDSNRDIYARLAMLEFAAGRIKDARAHIDTAVTLDTEQNDKEVDAAYRLIDPAARRKLFALREKNYQEEMAALSPDQKAVRAKMGVDYREETYDAAGYHQVTWWYGGNHPFVAYTFLNGKLESVYRP